MSASTRKVTDAILVWRWYSREIGADLAHFYHRNVAEWLTGEMDSAEFLMLVEGLPDRSLFKTWAERGGDWTDDQYVAARTANEIALSRADGKGYMPDLLVSPAQVQAEMDREAAAAAKRRRGLAELRGEV